MNTFYLVMAIILFVLAVVAFIFGVRAIKTGKTLNTRYNQMRSSLPESEQKKRDKLVGLSHIIGGFAAVAIGVSAFYQFEGIYHWLGLALLLVNIIIDVMALR